MKGILSTSAHCRLATRAGTRPGGGGGGLLRTSDCLTFSIYNLLSHTNRVRACGGAPPHISRRLLPTGWTERVRDSRDARLGVVDGPLRIKVIRLPQDHALCGLAIQERDGVREREIVQTAKQGLLEPRRHEEVTSVGVGVEVVTEADHDVVNYRSRGVNEDTGDEVGHDRDQDQGERGVYRVGGETLPVVVDHEPREYHVREGDQRLGEDNGQLRQPVHLNHLLVPVLHTALLGCVLLAARPAALRTAAAGAALVRVLPGAAGADVAALVGVAFVVLAVEELVRELAAAAETVAEHRGHDVRLQTQVPQALLVTVDAALAAHIAAAPPPAATESGQHPSERDEDEVPDDLQDLTRE
eukprot:Hpha_TRINITY_DN15173_c2_g12::TRINITY_DN15173_c2_g12_i1::g.129169::m.129169